MGFSCVDTFRFSFPIPLPASPDPPEALAWFPRVGTAIPGNCSREEPLVGLQQDGDWKRCCLG